MKLLRVLVENVRALGNGVYKFADPSSGEPFDSVVVTGSMGSGKTTLLEAIVIAKERVAGYGPPPDPRALLRRGESNGRVKLTFLLEPDELASAGLSEPIQLCETRLSGPASAVQGDPRFVRLLATLGSGSPKVIFFPATRRSEAADSFELPPSVRDEAILCVSRAGDKFGPVIRWLRRELIREGCAVAMELQSSGLAMGSVGGGVLAKFRSGLAELCPDLRLHGVAKDGRELHFERKNGDIYEHGELSDAERDALLFAGTIAMLSPNQSILLIDRLDLFASGDLQPSWLAALARLAPKSQIITTATSERLAAAVPRGQLISLGPTQS